MLLREILAYSEDEKILGTVVEYSRIKETATLKRGEDTYEVSANGLVVMEKIGKIQGVDIFEYDVFQGVGSEVRYMLNLNEGKIVLSTINNRLEVTQKVAQFGLSEFKNYAHSLDLIGHYFELKEELKTVDFNIQIVKMDEDYYYAGNNKDAEEIDMIKVIYIGAVLFEEEDYSRFTITHEEYLDHVENKRYIEVEPSALAMHVANKIYSPITSEDNCGEDCACSFNDEDKEDMCGCGNVRKEDCECEDESLDRENPPKAKAKAQAPYLEEKLDSLFD